MAYRGSTAQGSRESETRGSSAPEAQHDRIRDAAVRLFTRQGYEGTSIKDLARELGMVPANLYNYYPNKQAILFDVVNYTLTDLLDRLRATAPEGDAPSRVRQMTVELVTRDLQDPVAAFVGHHGLNGLAGPARRRVSVVMADIRQMWMDVVAEGIAEGSFDTPAPKLAVLNTLTLCSFISSWFSSEGEFSPEYIANYVAAVVLRSLGYPEPLPIP
jgi:TetR/AcrR family transcriptional regulator, cholesterol catabolism regulator